MERMAKSITIFYKICISNQFLSNLIPEIVACFNPDESVIYSDVKSETPERMIFEIEGNYRYFEEEHLKELEKIIEQSEVNV